MVYEARIGLSESAKIIPMSTAAPSRLLSLNSALDAWGIDAFLAWHPVTMGYLHNFHEGAIERFMALGLHRDGRSAIICPSLSATQAARAGIKDIRSWRDGEDPLALFMQLAEEWNLKSAIIAVDDEMPAHMLLAMQMALPAALFRTGGEILGSLMRVKAEDELNLMRRAARIADEAYVSLLGSVKAGLTERQVDHILRNEMARLGGEPTFCIIAAGANGAEPHHLSDDTVLTEGDVVIMDFGCHVEGYQSDVTRTIAIGSASDEAKKVYRIVYDAHMAGRRAIGPSVPAEHIDAAAREVIAGAGYGEYFMHRLGHGIGRKGHEEPFIIAGNASPVEVGHCFSIEPGIYLPGKFGVRIENIVTVTPDGHESLNAEPPAELPIV